MIDYKSDLFNLKVKDTNKYKKLNEVEPNIRDYLINNVIEIYHYDIFDGDDIIVFYGNISNRCILTKTNNSKLRNKFFKWFKANKYGECKLVESDRIKCIDKILNLK